MKDLGSFTLPCSIGGMDVDQAMCDLWLSINLMPLSIFKKLGIGEVLPTTVTLQLTDHSIIRSEGKIDDVLVQVDKFISCSLHHSRLWSWQVSIDYLEATFFGYSVSVNWCERELTIKVDDQQVKFNVFNALKYSDELESSSLWKKLNVKAGFQKTQSWTFW